MINQEHAKKTLNLLTSGADRDITPTLADTKKGFYFDANNMSIRVKDGNQFALQTINGATIKFQPTLTSKIGSYDGSLTTCLGICSCNGHIIELFAPLTQFEGLFVPFIMIDGQIMVASEKLQMSDGCPFQIAVNESCDGGLICLTDFNENHTPYLFNVQSIITEFNNQAETYFSNFNNSTYTLALDISPDHPVFDQYVSGNLPCGSYSYAIRYSDLTGNKTNWSVGTPLIPVVRNISVGSPYYPGNKTLGGQEGEVSNSGIQIKFRVNNLSGYSYIEIRRVAYNVGAAVNYVPVAQVLKYTALDITKAVNQHTIATFADDASISSDWTTLTDIEDTATSTTVLTFKSPRFFDNRLIRGNIKRASKDLTSWKTSGFNTFSDGRKLIPIIKDIGSIGHKDPENQINYKSFKRGEKEQLGVYFFDELGNTSFVVPIANSTTTDSIQMPDRRDVLSGDSLTLSDNPTTTIDVNGNLNYTYEAFDLNDSFALQKKAMNLSIVCINHNGYVPFRPKNANSDMDISGESYNINTAVSTGQVNRTSYVSGTAHDYNPKGFAPQYKSLGLALKGINPPSWAKGFSIVRTKPANRVVAQGIGVYRLNSETSANGAYKNANMLTCSFPDINSGLSSIDILSNQYSDKYKIQLVSPLGFFSEVYSGNSGDVLENAYRNNCIDLISYARILHETGSINTNLVGQGNLDYHTKFGQWRNGLGTHSTQVSKYPKKLYGFSAFLPSNTIDSCYDIQLDTNIYDGIYWGGKLGETNDMGHQTFHEPFYIVNIIDDSADIASGNTTSYLETGHIQKLNALIGISDGTTATYYLVDERVEDCIASSSSEYRYIYVGDQNDRYLDISQNSNAAIINAAILTNGSYTFFDNNHNETVTIKGTYAGDIYNKSITFINIPVKTSKIYVKYDDASPIKLFIGDTVISEAVFSPIDTIAGNGSTSNQDLHLYCGMPYCSFTFNSNYLRPFKVDRTDHAMLSHGIYFSQSNILMEAIRQWVIMFCCETLSNIPFAYHIDSAGGDNSKLLDGTSSILKAFPTINYVQRPADWEASQLQDNFNSPKLDGQKRTGQISDTYLFDFTQEEITRQWSRGGFYYTYGINKDYSVSNNSKLYSSKPKVGYAEKSFACTEIDYSNPLPINAQDITNYRTFPSTSVYLLQDTYGEIKYLYNNQSPKGNNLIAVTEKGIALIITEKTLLTQTSGNDLGLIDSNGTFITQSVWLSQTIGSNSEMWRGMAEYDNMLFIPNNHGVYALNGENIIDIGRENKGGYFSKLHPVLSNIREGYQTKVTGAYNINDEEYWLGVGVNNINYALIDNDESISLSFTDGDTYTFQGAAYISGTTKIIRLPLFIDTGASFNIINRSNFTLLVQGLDLTFYTIGPFTTISSLLCYTFTKLSTNRGYYSYDVTIGNIEEKVYCFSKKHESWIGTFDYNFEKMLTNDVVYGVKDGVTYSLDSTTPNIYYYANYNFNTIPLQSSVTYVVAPKEAISLTKELISVLVSSSDKPYRIEFRKDINSVTPNCFLDSTMGSLYLKDYLGGYYNQVPRQTSGNRYRLQQEYFYVTILSTPATNIAIREVLSSYKILK